MSEMRDLRKRPAARYLLAVLILLLAGCGQAASAPTVSVTYPPNHGTTVFLIVMENHDWSSIVGSPNAPYINRTLLPQASYATQYYNPPGNHPSLPNYLWLEAGTNCFPDTGCITDDGYPSQHSTKSRHLVDLLDRAGISWRAYEENISGQTCPLKGNDLLQIAAANGAPGFSDYLYAPRHDPFVYFDDVTGNRNPHDAFCINHIRPFSRLAGDLQHNTVARYNFLAPNICDDMHSPCPILSSTVRQGDKWLSRVVPAIMKSAAYRHGVLFITWDEGEGNDGPIGMIVLSPYAKGHGYTSSIHYTHSSTLRTIEEIFGVHPLLGGAAQATDLSDLFRRLP